MLSLGFRYGERLILRTEDGMEIVVVVTGRQGKTTRLAIEAPRSVCVTREKAKRVETAETKG